MRSTSSWASPAADVRALGRLSSSGGLVRWLGPVAAVLLILLPRPAAADLRRDAARLVSAWQPRATVSHLAPLFLRRGRAQTAALPRGFFERRQKARCLTVAALAERHVSFGLAPAPAAAGPAAADRAEQHKSAAGLAQLVSCDPEPPRAVQLTMTSGGGTVEVLAAWHSDQLVPPETVLPERVVGPLPEAATSRPPPPPPLGARLAQARLSARLDGAAAVTTITTRASATGAGALVVELLPGCHRLVVLAGQSEPDSAVDVDAEVRRRGSETVLSEDRSPAPDARLQLCLAVKTPLWLRFRGAGGPAEVVILAVRWPLPESLSAQWGERARAGLGAALWRRRAPSPPAGDHILEVLGGPGVTLLPQALEPGACYLAALALSSGQASAGLLSAEVGAQHYQDRLTGPDGGAALSFCAPAVRTARLKVNVRGPTAIWLLVLWRLTP